MRLFACFFVCLFAAVVVFAVLLFVFLSYLLLFPYMQLNLLILPHPLTLRQTHIYLARDSASFFSTAEDIAAAEPLSMIAYWCKPLASGDINRHATRYPPADTPNMVTLLGSPLKLSQGKKKKPNKTKPNMRKDDCSTLAKQKCEGKSLDM